MGNSEAWRQHKCSPFYQEPIRIIPFYKNPTAGYLTPTHILLVALTAPPSHITRVSFTVIITSCPSTWLFAPNLKPAHLFYILIAKNTTQKLSILGTKAGLICMWKEENYLDNRNQYLFICLGFFSMFTAPTDHMFFSSANIDLIPRWALLPVLKECNDLAFIIIHTSRSNANLENTHTLLDLCLKNIRNMLAACIQLTGCGLSSASLQLRLKCSNLGGRTRRLLSSTEQRRAASPPRIWNCSGHSGWQNSLTQMERCQRGLTHCSWKASHRAFNHHEWRGLNFSSRLKYAGLDSRLSFLWNAID